MRKNNWRQLCSPQMPFYSLREIAVLLQFFHLLLPFCSLPQFCFLPLTWITSMPVSKFLGKGQEQDVLQRKEKAAASCNAVFPGLGSFVLESGPQLCSGRGKWQQWSGGKAEGPHRTSPTTHALQICCYFWRSNRRCFLESHPLSLPCSCVALNVAACRNYS